MTHNEWLSSLVVLALLAGCGDDGREKRADETLPSFNELPLTSFALAYGGTSNEQLLQVEYALEACMQGQGFDYWALVVEPEEPQAVQSMDREAFISGRQQAALEVKSSTEVEDLNGKYVAALSESDQAAYSKAMYANQDGLSGCLAEARSGAQAERSTDLVDLLWDKQIAIADEANLAPKVSDARHAIYECLSDYGILIDAGELDPESALSQIREQSRFDQDVSEDDEREDHKLWATRLWDCGYPNYLQAFFDERMLSEQDFVDSELDAYQDLIIKGTDG